MKNNSNDKASVAVIMGSNSDYNVMSKSEEILESFSIKYITRIISAHRTPDRMFDFAKSVDDIHGVKIIIAGAGGAAHLPGMVASLTHIPVIGVPINSSILNGIDSLLSIVQMPFGVPVMTMSIGEAGAKNAALAALRILSIENEELEKKLIEYHKNQNAQVDLIPKKL
ncbi:5-(carboxyamino)imidazole ribonucleotide mutase [Anaplasmataceae bacterium AB001_6]|nr:5-(carboxyamino)imidazole ribonucleotide mutase [Anaplasmataceae bacterium AB001_6]